VQYRKGAAAFDFGGHAREDATVLILDKDDRALLFDLAAQSNSILVAADLTEYINERDIVRVALRTAKDVEATDEEWQEFINKLEIILRWRELR